MPNNKIQPLKQPKLDPALKALDIFVGKWNTEGKSKNSYNATVDISAIDTYEWLEGGFFLIHRWNACIGNEKTNGIEIIGYNASNQNYFTHSFDNQGNYIMYRASLENNIWRILSESERFIGTFSNNSNVLVGRWEILNNGEWQPWMNVKLTKVK